MPQSTAIRNAAPLRAELRRSLADDPPRLPPKVLYDAEGARLFEEITRLPEYYPTQTETRIFETHLPEIAELVGAGVRVVEFGSGSGEKTELLLKALESPHSYIPVDIAHEQLGQVAARISQIFPDLDVRPLAADFTRPFQLPEPNGAPTQRPGRPLLFFPGSSIGNFEPSDARDFLNRAGTSLGPDAGLLIGFDLVKSRTILEPAYDDSQGVTAAFNRNALRHVNQILGTDFSPECYTHRAVWNADASRIEMHLVAAREQVVTVPSDSPETPQFQLVLDEGDHIVTEHSYKYTPDFFQSLTDDAGWETVRTWMDPRRWFAVRFLRWTGKPDDR